MLSPFLPGLDATGRAQRRCWFLIQKLNLARFGGSHRKSIHSLKILPQTFSHLGLSTRFTISHPKSPVPGERARRYRNVPPPVQGRFLS